MGHDNHHHVDDLSGFSLFRVVWPAALLLIVVMVGRNCCYSSGCCDDKGACKTECSKDAHGGGHGEEKKAEGAHH